LLLPSEQESFGLVARGDELRRSRGRKPSGRSSRGRPPRGDRLSSRG
jgi:hypothetical protein